MQQRTESFLRGALVLTLAGVITKLLGALFNPIIVRIFARYDGHAGNLGKALVGIPAVSYTFVLGFAAIGFNVAISRMVAQRSARGDYGGALRAFRYSVGLIAAVALVASAALYLAAPALAAWRGAPEAAAGYRAVAPGILLAAVLSAYRGLFQGMQQMTPNAVTQVLEQLGRVAVGVALVVALAPSNIVLAAAGANFGAVAGATVGILYLLSLYRRRRIGEAPAPLALEAPGRIYRELFALAAPIAVINVLLPALMEIDNYVVLHRLVVGGLHLSAALDQVGRVQNSFTTITLPAVVSSGLYLALVPVITAALAAGQLEQMRSHVRTAYKLTLAVALPSAVGLFLLAGDIYGILYGTRQGGEVLRALSLAIPFLMLHSTATGVLQGGGHVWVAARNMLLGLVLKAVLTWVWATEPGTAATFAGYATACGLALTTALSVWDVHRLMGTGFDALELLVRPGGAAALMGAVVWLGAGPVERLLRSHSLGAVAVMAVGIVVYGVALLAFGGLSAQELERLPRFGGRAARLLQRAGLLRR